MSGSTVWNVIQFVFIVCPRQGLPKYETKMLTTCFYLRKLFKKNQKSLNLVSPPFLKRIFLALYSINWPNFIAWLSLLWEILCNIICVVMIYFPVYDVINFEITLAFLSSSHFPTWPKKSVEKFRYLKNKKSFLDEVKSIFHYF